MKISTKVTATVVAFILAFSAILAGVVNSRADDFEFDGIEISPLSHTQNLMEGLAGDDEAEEELSGSDIVLEKDSVISVTDFAFDLFRAAYEGDNILISPYSVYTALAMTANGADGKTRTEIENALRMTVDEMNEFLSLHTKKLPNKWPGTVDIANSVWFRNDLDRFRVKESYLEALYEYYNAEAFAAPFDSSTLNNINTWVSDNTEGVIDQLISEIPPSAVMYLINTVFIEARWHEVYEDENVIEKVFHNENGGDFMTDFLTGTTDALITLDNALGFYKHYAYGDIYFIALLPNESIKLEELIGSLDAEAFHNALNAYEGEYYYPLAAPTFPSFTDEFDTNMVDVLKSLGIRKAFLTNADFSNIGSAEGGEIFVDSVIHKTKIEVSAWGTKAAAATSVQIDMGSVGNEDPTPLIFDRPFLYMIVGGDDIPLFIGVIENLSDENVLD